MKNLIVLVLLSFVVFSCKKDAKIDEKVTTPIDSTKIKDSLTMQAANDPNAVRVEPITDQASLGKVIFTENGKTIISFDTQANTGKIKLNSKEYALDNLIFSENNYNASGNGVKIVAENGNFQDMVSDCNYGTFPTITITLNDKKVQLNNIKVQDCPNYN